jgi:type IV pilus assembly protein PilA
MSKRINSSGLTLIELMIVIAIIGILAAIAIPQFASFRQKSYNSAALSDLRNVRSILVVYYADHKHYP